MAKVKTMKFVKFECATHILQPAAVHECFDHMKKKKAKYNKQKQKTPGLLTEII